MRPAATGRELIPIDEKRYPEYRALWKSKLEVTPYDCGRVVVLPAFEFERSISVYSRGRKDQRAYRVTYVWMAANAWQVSDGMRFPKKAKSVKTNRIDADIPEETALLLRKLWSQVVGKVRGRYDPKVDNDVVTLDAVDFEWSLQRTSGQQFAARLNINAKFTPRILRLADLSNITLPAYCKAKPVERAAIIRKIEKEVKQLLRDWQE